MNRLIRSMIAPVKGLRPATFLGTLGGLLLLAGLLALPVLPALAAGTGDEHATSSDHAIPLPTDFREPSESLKRRVADIYERLKMAQTNQERSNVIDQLTDAGPEAIPILLAELDKNVRSTWAATVFALGAIGDPRVIPVLERELTHQRGRVYMEVLYALSLAGEPSALLRAMRSTNANVIFDHSATAVDFIAGAKGPEAVPYLMREIPRRAPLGRQAGLGALGTICDDSALPFLLTWSRREDPIERRYALIALARIGAPRAIPRMMEALADKDDRVREAAVEGLGYLRAKEATPALIELLAAENPAKIRQSALWSLGLIGGSNATEALLAIWPDAPVPERALLLKALGKRRDPVSAPLLTRIANGPDALSLDAARALVRIEGTQASDAMLAVCTAAVNLDAGLAVSGELVRRGDPRAVPCVLKWLKEEIDLRHRLSPLAEEILQTLPHDAARSAAESLEALARDIAAPALAHKVRAAAESVRLVNELGPEIDPWLNLLESGTPHEVELAINQLGSLGDPRAVGPLRRLFGQIEASRAHLIPAALGRIKSERATPFLISLLTDDLYRVPTLRRAREEAAAALARCSGQEHVARALREAFLAERGTLFVPLMSLAKIRGKAAIPELLELKTLLLRKRGADQVLRHERVNWAIRMLRAGQEIPYEEIRDIR